ncbi:hypothetical protein HDU98_010790 [Podochytrium sp. JEL0797]|nr:hypothetical protein HDU98_010790 [Podochytrium sp. JEL0797]
MNNLSPPPFGSTEMRALFCLDPEYLALNHGSFGAPPRSLVESRMAHSLHIESNPDAFCKIDYDPALDAALVPVSKLLGLGGKVDDMVFLANATTGVNAVLRSLKQILMAANRFPKPNNIKSQKILCFNTVYGNVLNAIEYTSQNDLFSLLQVDIIMPCSDAEVVRRVADVIESERNQGHDIVLAVFDMVSSVPGIICPYRELTDLFRKHNILTCVDAAHAIGQVPIDLGAEWKPDFLVSNLHKWLFVPRGCCVFYCHPRFHGVVRHPVVSEVRKGDWRRGFHWVGTNDVSAFLTAPDAIAFRDWIGGEDKIMHYCHDLALRGGQIVATRLGTQVMRGVGSSDEKTFGDGLYAAMVNVGVPEVERVTGEFMAGLQVLLLKKWKVGVSPFVYAGKNWMRLSAQVYLNEADFHRVADVLYEVFFGREEKL